MRPTSHAVRFAFRAFSRRESRLIRAQWPERHAPDSKVPVSTSRRLRVIDIRQRHSKQSKHFTPCRVESGLDASQQRQSSFLADSLLSVKTTIIRRISGALDNISFYATLTYGNVISRSLKYSANESSESVLLIASPISARRISVDRGLCRDFARSSSSSFSSHDLAGDSMSFRALRKRINGWFSDQAAPGVAAYLDIPRVDRLVPIDDEAVQRESIERSASRAPLSWSSLPRAPGNLQSARAKPIGWMTGGRFCGAHDTVSRCD